MNQSLLIPHLFRTEFRKIVAVIVRLFGLQHIETAEDITSETFLLAAETWGKKGIPENPTAWLYTVAKNKTKDYLKRNQIFNEKVVAHLKIQSNVETSMDVDVTQENLKDSELRMIFAVCHPSIPTESQIGLALRILFGLGINEIADAFLSNKETINKRLHRAKEKLREEEIEFDLPNENEISQRLSSVYRTLYLLFNEGYYSASQNTLIKRDICLQALQLAYSLTENNRTNTPELNALIALMCFHASRLDARLEDNAIILLDKQDRSKWDNHLIQTGEFYLNKSARGDHISKYHLEAAIGYWHTQTNDSQEKWAKILSYYNLLLQIDYSPIAALNRTYALFKNYGAEKAIQEALKLGLENNHLYHSLLGEFYLNTDKSKSLMHFKKAKDLANTDSEKQLLQDKIEQTEKKTIS